MTRMAGTMTRALALLTAGVALTALPLLAQDTPPPPPPTAQQPAPPPAGPGGGGGRRGMNPEKRLQAMKDQLGLTDDQTAKVKIIQDEGRGKMEAIRNDSSLSDEDKRTKSAALMQDESKRVRAVLTAEQQPKYDEMVEHMRGGGRGGRKKGGDSAPPPPPPPPQQ